MNKPTLLSLPILFLSVAAFAQTPTPTPTPVPTPSPSPSPSPSPNNNGHQSRHQQEKAAGAALSDVSAASPDNAAIFTSRAAVNHVVRALGRTTVTAGAPTKEVIETPMATGGGTEVYLELDWASIRDRRALELDGNRFSPRIGMDWVGPADIVLGGSFTFSYEDRSSDVAPVTSKINNYIFNLYAGKNFADWLNIGASFTYAFESQIAKSFGGRFYGDTNVFAVSPFIGLAHTWGPISFSSTATYIYQHNDVSIDASPALPLSGDIDSHTYLHITELEYAVTDKFSVGANFNTNVVISEDDTPLTAFGTNDDFWVTLGAKASYQLFDYVGVSLQFQADLANEDYYHYLTSGAITWSF